MSLYIIDYDLSDPGRNYDDLISAIKEYDYAKICKSSWIVSTDESASDIRDNLKANLDTNDRIYVGELTGKRSSYNLPKSTITWLKEH